MTAPRDINADRWLWILPVLAPLLVAVGLLGLGSAPVVFVGYHGVVCLGSVLVFGRRADLGLRTRRGLWPGLALGVILGAVPPLAFVVLPDLFPDPARLREVLTGWSLDPDRPAALLAFMALVNGPAEELFWRGLLQDRLLRGWRSATALVLLFSSYHALTVGALAPDAGGVALMLAGVIAAAAFWTWTRWRWHTLWPALLSHTGASIGYMLVCARLLA
jgi:membrane protease YdiL (CAAX protease family)